MHVGVQLQICWEGNFDVVSYLNLKITQMLIQHPYY